MRRAAEFERDWNQYLCTGRNISCHGGNKSEPSICTNVGIYSDIQLYCTWRDVFSPLLVLTLTKPSKQIKRELQAQISISRASKKSNIMLQGTDLFVSLWTVVKKTNIKCLPFHGQIQNGDSYSMCHVVVIFLKPPNHCIWAVFHILKEKVDIVK